MKGRLAWFEIDRLPEIYKGLERYERLTPKQRPTLETLQADLLALCAIDRTLIKRIQYLEAELQELRG